MPDFLVFGVSAAVIVISLAVIDIQRRYTVPRVLVMLGGASYSIYLVHFSTISLLAAFMTRGDRVPMNNAVFLTVALVGIFFGFLFHHWIDRPLHRFLRSRERRAPAPPPPCPCGGTDPSGHLRHQGSRPDMNVTVCIPTRNRPDDLAQCLNSIAASSVPVSEIVVSDDSTDDRTRDLVAACYPHVKYVFGPRKGLGPNRNSAIAAASSDWILFLDDDARLGSDFLTEMMKARYANADSRLILTGIEKQVKGLVFPNDQDFLGFQKLPYGSNKNVNTVVINATLFPAALFKEMLFDPRLIYGYDEVDIASSARGAGYRIVLIPSAVNLHFPSPVNRDYYSPHTEAARIYVTFKRYARAERRPIKALLFLVASFLHSLAHHLRRFGLSGIAGAVRMHKAAMTNIALWLGERCPAGPDAQPRARRRPAPKRA